MSRDVDLAGLLAQPRFPRAARYDPRWVTQNQMGPHALWLTEWLCEELALSPGMRVLDLGCGRAIASVFLAREFGVTVYACDLYCDPSENWARICEAGLGGQIIPLRADARALPFAMDFFDVIVCVDAFIYFGTDDLYLPYLKGFLKPGARVGVVQPGLMADFEAGVPEHIQPFWGSDCWSWHTVEWWRQHWERTGLLEVERVDALPRGCQLYLQWKRALAAAGDMRPSVQTDIHVLEQDAGRYIGFVRMIARKENENE